MRILTNENIPGSVVLGLRGLGHDVLSVKESMRGDDDTAILDRAQRESRLVVTQDKDFGELAFRQRLPAQCGVILFRLSEDDPDANVQRMLDVIGSSPDWSGQFVVAGDSRIRVRALP